MFPPTAKPPRRNGSATSDPVRPLPERPPTSRRYTRLPTSTSTPPGPKPSDHRPRGPGCGNGRGERGWRHPEQVIEGRTGFLVPVGDARALAGRVLDLLADEEFRLRMGGRRRRMRRSGSGWRGWWRSILRFTGRTTKVKAYRLKEPHSSSVAQPLLISPRPRSKTRWPWTETSGGKVAGREAHREDRYCRRPQSGPVHRETIGQCSCRVTRI